MQPVLSALLEYLPAGHVLRAVVGRGENFPEGQLRHCAASPAPYDPAGHVLHVHWAAETFVAFDAMPTGHAQSGHVGWSLVVWCLPAGHTLHVAPPPAPNLPAGQPTQAQVARPLPSEAWPGGHAQSAQ